MEAPSSERNEGVPMDKKPLPTVASLPLPVYLLALTLTLLCMVLDCVPPNLVGAFLLLMVLFAITPVIFVVALLIKTLRRLITEAKDKTVSAIEEKIEEKKEEPYVRTGI